MKALFFTHAGLDFGADGLAHGLSALGELIDWPVKPELHGGNRQPYYPAPFELQQHYYGAAQLCDELNYRDFDVIVIGDASLDTLARVRELREFIAPLSDRLVFYDGADDCTDKLSLVMSVTGLRPVLSFKRELPIGAHWALPLAFGFPEERIDTVTTQGRTGVCMIAASYPHRQHYARALQSAGIAGVRLSTGYESRIPIEDHGRAYAAASVGISVSGAGWMTYRHLEVAAFGCCPIMDLPSIQWEHGFMDGTECRYCTGEADLVAIARELLNDPKEARRIASNAQRTLRTFHTTRALAERVVEFLRKA